MGVAGGDRILGLLLFGEPLSRLSYSDMVGVAGFEPAVTCSQGKWLTKLAHTPVGLAGFEPAAPAPPVQCANQAAPQPVVGIAGLEPATSRTRSVRPTKLGHIPRTTFHEAAHGANPIRRISID